MAAQSGDLIDIIAAAVDPEAFSASTVARFQQAIEIGGPTHDVIQWMPRIINARKIASRVIDVMRPTQHMLHAADQLLVTTPDASPGEIFDMMLYAERYVATLRKAPGIELDDISPEEYFENPPAFGR